MNHFIHTQNLLALLLTTPVLLISTACPIGSLYPNRVPVVTVDIPCADGSDECDTVQVLDVGYGGSGSAEFIVFNQGWASLAYETTLTGGADIETLFDLVSLSDKPISAGSSETFTLIYKPSDYLERSGEIEFRVQSDSADSAPILIPFMGTTSLDGDGDSFQAVEAGGDDCDDNEFSVHPGAEEIWYDGVDQDCDGNDCDQDSDGMPSTADECRGTAKTYDCDDDGDGYDVYSPSNGCEGGDCDDSDPSIFKGC